MTNYEQLFQEQMSNPEFAKAYYDARLERTLTEMLDTLKDKIYRNESKENLIHLIDSIQKNIHSTISQTAYREAKAITAFGEEAFSPERTIYTNQG